jgi:F-type H+-transporting ATPase subunit gamma
LRSLRLYLKYKSEGISLALGLLDIKRRIKSVKNTQKITKAVSLVATSKFGKIRPVMYRVSTYFEKYSEIMEGIVLNMDLKESPFFKSNNSDTDLYIIITSDSGLCGNYNTNVINTALKDMYSKKVLLITIGERGRNYFKRRGYETLSEFVEMGDNPSIEDVNNIMLEAANYFKQGKVKDVYIVYTRFYTPLKHEAKVLKVLPIEKSKENSDKLSKPEPTQTVGSAAQSRAEYQSNALWLFEPSQVEVFEFVFPKYLNSLMYYSVINSISSEYSSRITSMDGATKNASDILTKLQNIYNKARQSSITQEITEIVSGAESLKG